ncbi:MAG: YicC/YloC family endoribonuclease, partial [Opitutales bacterium]
MKSMTGFGRGEASGDGYDVSVEISSVNRKALDVSVALPREWAMLERQISERVRGAMARGSVRVIVQISAQADSVSWSVDDKAVHHTLDHL